MDVVIRAARAEEAPALSALALRSKGHWGYDGEFLESCRQELIVRADELAGRRTVVAESGGRIVGFSTVEGGPPAGSLGMLFVEPDTLGLGIGRRLFTHAVARAEREGFRRLTVDADPHAEGFYLAMGAERIGRTASGSIPGRMLPLLAIDLPHRTPHA